MDGRINQGKWHNIFGAVYIVLLLVTLAILKSLDKLPLSISTFDFFLLAFCIFRLVRLFTYDSITEHIRDYFKKFESGPEKEAFDLLDCPWCTGVWIALPVVFFFFLTSLAWYPILILALSGIATFIQITILRIGKEV